MWPHVTRPSPDHAPALGRQGLDCNVQLAQPRAGAALLKVAMTKPCSHSPNRRLAAAACVLTLASFAGPAAAYNLFTYGNNQALKWGNNTLGTPGGVVTWSLMADGTTLDPSTAGLGMSGVSSLSGVFAQVGGQAPAMAALQAAFAAWSAVANIQFVQVGETGSLPFGAPYGGAPVVGSIRIGAFAIAGNTGAVGYAPPPNGATTLEGDVIFNASNRFGLPAGSEGAPYALFPASNNFFYLNDLAGLFTHELGHALGLGHSEVPTAVMCGYVNAGADGSACAWADPDHDGFAPITHLPKADDIAGIRALYGAAPAVPEPQTWTLWLTGVAGLGAWVQRRRRPAQERS